MLARGVQKLKGAHHIRANELRRPIDRTVHVRLRGKVEYRGRTPLAENPLYRAAIGDISLNEGEARVCLEVLQVESTSRVRQLVHDDDARRRFLHGKPGEVRPDKPGPSSNDQRFHCNSPAPGRCLI